MLGKPISPEITLGKPCRLNHCSHGAVESHDASAEDCLQLFEELGSVVHGRRFSMKKVRMEIIYKNS